MLLNSFYAILGTFYTLLNNTDLDLSYFDLSYVFPGHIDSVKRGLTVIDKILFTKKILFDPSILNSCFEFEILFHLVYILYSIDIAFRLQKLDIKIMKKCFDYNHFVIKSSQFCTRDINSTTHLTLKVS